LVIWASVMGLVAKAEDEAAECAASQGKFWEMHDLIFENQDHLELADLHGYARRLGLDMIRFAKKLEGHEHLHVVRRQGERVDEGPREGNGGMRNEPGPKNAAAATSRRARPACRSGTRNRRTRRPSRERQLAQHVIGAAHGDGQVEWRRHGIHPGQCAPASAHARISARLRARNRGTPRTKRPAPADKAVVGHVM
jgi:hypothetical protein